MAVTIDLGFDFPDWDEKLRKNRRRIDLFMAAQMQTNRGMLFDAEGSRNGHKKWAPLKFRKGQILSKSGALRRSLAPSSLKGLAGPDGLVRFGSDFWEIGTKLFYARMMNDGTTGLPGGVLKPRKALALKIPASMGGGTKIAKEGKFIFRKSVKIPARNFDQMNERDEKEMGEALTNLIAKIMME
jgi:phage gpG-like protein